MFKKDFRLKGINIYNLLTMFSFLLIVAANIWVLDKNHGFLFDDYDWLNKAHFWAYDKIFSLFPSKAYNDRPVGAVIIKLLYDLFGFKYTAFHLFFLIIHILNSVLVYFLIKNIIIDLGIDKDKYKFVPILTASVFGIWPKSLLCVQWIGAIFDLLGATFVLIIFNLYLIKRFKKNKIIYNVLIIVLYYMALRTKEMTIVTPALLILYELYKGTQCDKKYLLKIRNYKFDISIISSIVIMILYFVKILQLSKSNKIVSSLDSAYYYTFSPAIIIKNIYKYIYMYFDYSKMEFVYGKGENIIIGLLIAIGLTWLFYMIKGAIRQNYAVLALGLAIIISLAPVLPMQNMQHILYLYLPSIFISILLSLFIDNINKKLSCINYIKPIFVNTIFIVLIFGLTYTSAVKGFRTWWLNVSTNNITSINDIKQFEKPDSGSTIYVLNVNDSTNVFNYGPGFINNIIFNDSTIKTVINPANIDKNKPYILLSYNADAHISFLESNKSKMEIFKVLPSEIKAGQDFNVQSNNMSAMAVDGQHFTKNSIIYLNGQPQQTFYGSEKLLTCAVPAEFYKKEGQLSVQIIDKSSITSNLYNVSIK